MKNNETILVVEDNPQIINFITYVLKQEEFPCVSATNGQTALNILVNQHIDLVLLDLGLPDIDGMEVIKKVRGWSDVPIIVVSARDQDKEKADALDFGADDYLTKPFSATELLARIRVAIRHLHKMSQKDVQPCLSVGELTIDLEKRQVFLKGNPIHLTPREYSLLSLFFKNIGLLRPCQYF